MRLDACVVDTILLPLKDLTLNVDWYSYPLFQYELTKKNKLIKKLT